MNQSERNRKHREARKQAGISQLTIMVPEKDKPRFRAEAAKARKEYEHQR